MAKFTKIQSDNVKTVREERYDLDGVHSHYIFSVKDDNGFAYKWQDDTLSDKATKATKKTAMCAYLMTQEKKEPAPVVTVEMDKHGLIGKKIMDA